MQYLTTTYFGGEFNSKIDFFFVFIYILQNGMWPMAVQRTKRLEADNQKRDHVRFVGWSLDAKKKAPTPTALSQKDKISCNGNMILQWAECLHQLFIFSLVGVDPILYTKQNPISQFPIKLFITENTRPKLWIDWVKS